MGHIRVFLAGLAIAGGVLAQSMSSLPSGGSGGGATGISCNPTSASGTTYACAPSPALGSYTAGLLVSFIPDVNGSGGATTLNISTLGPKSVKQSDCTTDPLSTDFVAGRLAVLSYSGTVFCEAPSGSAPGGPFGSFQYNNSGALGGSANFNVVQVAPPVSVTAALAGAGAGLLSNGAYQVGCSNRVGTLDTGIAYNPDGSPVVALVTVTDHTVNGKLTEGCPVGPTGTTSRNLWRTSAGGTSLLFLHTIPDNTTTTYLDNIADASLGAILNITNQTGGMTFIGATEVDGIGTGANFTQPVRQINTEFDLYDTGLNPELATGVANAFTNFGEIGPGVGGIYWGIISDSGNQGALIADGHLSGVSQLDYTHPIYLWNGFRGNANGGQNAHEVHTAWNVDYAIIGGAPGLALYNESDPANDELGGYPFGGMFLCGNYPHRTSTGGIVPECPAVLTAASAHSTDIGFAIVKGGWVAGTYTPQTADMMDLFDVDGTTLLPFHILPSGYVAQALHTPASSAEACTVGQWVDDASFHYVCTASNTWKRIVLVAF